MKIIIDMNLSPDWVLAFAAENIEAVHWFIVGSPCAEDTGTMDYARANHCLVFTQSLDFGTISALTQAEKSECCSTSHSKHFARSSWKHGYCRLSGASSLTRTRRVARD